MARLVDPIQVESVVQGLLGTVARTIGGTDAVRRFHHLLVVLELCRHPFTVAQAERAGEHATDPALVAEILRLADLPGDTLGRALTRFYADVGLSVPGASASELTYDFVAHDLNHVIAGYPPTGAGELAPGVFQMRMNDSEISWLRCPTNLAVHEAGLYAVDDLAPKTSTLDHPGVADTFPRSLARGTRCTDDFAAADHLAMVRLPLAPVRERYGVAPPEVSSERSDPTPRSSSSTADQVTVTRIARSTNRSQPLVS